jgi:nucleoid-associated protein YgaU
VSGPIQPAGRGTMTPAVIAATAFAVLAAVVSVAFVAARGGLQLPVAPTAGSPAAIASAAATPPALGPTAGPSSTAAAPPATPPPVPPPVSPAPATSPPGPPDPLLALSPCPDHPGCFVYTVRRGDSYTAISDRFGVLLWIMDALNPEVTDKRVIVVGQALYLGRDPTARLELCPDGTCHLYVVRSGDTLSRIAGRYGLSVAAIAALNPGLDPSVIVTGQLIRLPLYEAP